MNKIKIINRLEDYLKLIQIDKYIYRFRPNNEWLNDIIINNQLYFATADEFDDPLDAKPTLNPHLVNAQQIKASFKKSNNNYSAMTVNRVIDYYTHYPDEWAELTNESFKEQNKMGYCCFTARWNNKLLWDHYTKHKGVALKFNVLKDKNLFKAIMKMNYSDNLPSIDFTEEYSLLKALSTKSSDYLKEDEIRICKPRKGTWKFKKSSLVEVIFGLIVNDNEIKRIINLFMDNHYSHLQFKKIKIIHNEFSIEKINHKFV